MSLTRLPGLSAGRYLGVDIGHDNLKVVEIEIGRNRAHLVNAGMAATPLHAVAEGTVTAPDLVGRALKGLFAARGITARECIGSVTGSSVLVRPITLAKRSAKDLARALPEEAAQYLNSPVSDMYLEGIPLPAPPGQLPTDMAALLIAAPRALVDSRVAALEQAGLDPIAMDVNALAILRAVMSPDTLPAAQTDPSKTVALVDLGASYTDMIIAQGDLPVFPRTIPIGGISFTNALAGVFGVDFEEAQAIKHNLSADLDNDPAADITASRVVHSLLEELVRDVRRSLAYYASTLGWEGIEGLVDRVILLGGGSRLALTPDYFANVLQMDVVKADLPPDSPVSVDPAAWEVLRDAMPLFLIAIGLAQWPLYAGKGGGA